MDKVCPRCGSLSSEKRFVGQFCADCYGRTVKLEVPRKVELQLCRSCGRIRTREWCENSSSNIERFFLSKCKGDYSNARVRLEPVPHCVFIKRTGDSFVEVRRDFELAYKECLCPTCNRASGGYYEAIVQLRGEKGRISSFGKRLLRKLEASTSVSKIEELKEGTDIYVVSKEKTAEVLASFGKKAKTSHKLFGVKDGRRVYRTTFCIRL